METNYKSNTTTLSKSFKVLPKCSIPIKIKYYIFINELKLYKKYLNR